MEVVRKIIQLQADPNCFDEHTQIVDHDVVLILKAYIPKDLNI